MSDSFARLRGLNAAQAEAAGGLRATALSVLKVRLRGVSWGVVGCRGVVLCGLVRCRGFVGWCGALVGGASVRCCGVYHTWFSLA